MSVRGRSACLVALAEGLCSHLNPPPALPATAAQKRSECLDVTLSVCVVIFSVLRLTPLGKPGSSAACGDSCRQQHAAGPGPQSELPLSGTSCVGQQPLLPLLHPPFSGALLCFCAPCPVAIMMPSALPCSKSFLLVLPPV